MARGVMFWGIFVFGYFVAPWPTLGAMMVLNAWMIRRAHWQKKVFAAGRKRRALMEAQ